MRIVRSPFGIVGCFMIMIMGIAAGASALADERRRRGIESYPDLISDRLKQRARDLSRLPDEAGGIRPKLVVIKEARRWKPGAFISVAFEAGSGDATLRKTVEEAARVWTQYANLTLDFSDPKTKSYREFSTDDSQYSASIRISFRTGGGWEGYWSAVGNDSVNINISKPWEPSMNLGGIETEKYEELVGIVLHEFGHALGAEHEHQHPGSGCNDEWRWDDDAGYVSTTDAEGFLVWDKYDRRPGIYTMMGGARNYWPRSKVDANMRQLKDQSAYDLGTFDRYSIMKYYFWSEFYKKGSDSPCYAAAAIELSVEDKIQIARIYDRDEKALAGAQQKRVGLAATLKTLRATLPPNTTLDHAIGSLDK